jgi:uncharacterized protein (UPF0332 family)
MFNPLDFLKLAEELKNIPTNEAKIRSSISRSYYATFLKAREWLRTQGWPIYNDARDHIEVRRGLIKRSTKGRMQGNKLASLYRQRGYADYDLTQKLEEKDAANAITLAKDIIKNCS